MKKYLHLFSFLIVFISFLSFNTIKTQTYCFSVDPRGLSYKIEHQTEGSEATEYANRHLYTAKIKTGLHLDIKISEFKEGKDLLHLYFTTAEQLEEIVRENENASELFGDRRILPHRDDLISFVRTILRSSTRIVDNQIITDVNQKPLTIPTRTTVTIQFLIRPDMSLILTIALFYLEGFHPCAWED